MSETNGQLIHIDPPETEEEVKQDIVSIKRDIGKVKKEILDLNHKTIPNLDLKLDTIRDMVRELLDLSKKDE